MPKINVAWWNLENLFDHENAVRDEELKAKLKSELKGWMLMNFWVDVITTDGIML